MRPHNAPWGALTVAQVDWLDDEVPRSKPFADIYYSAENGLLESQHTFITGSDLTRRLQCHRYDSFCIGEAGFGSGLNFLLSWRCWSEIEGDKPQLHYVATEHHPLQHKDLARALHRWPSLRTPAEDLLACYPPPLPGVHRLAFADGRVLLDLWFADTKAVVCELAETHSSLVDAWYLDGFAPAANPDMWCTEVFNAMATLSREQATVATFTAAGQVRRDLIAAGFDMSKTAGFGRKKECLRGWRSDRPSTTTPVSVTPWDCVRNRPQKPDHVLVIGAGLAGCASAAALARRGVQVTVLDSHGVAEAASGNSQGVLYTRLSHQHSALVDFALQSFVFASTTYRDLLTDGVLQAGVDGDLCGCLQQVPDAAEVERMAPLLKHLGAIAHTVTPEDAGRVLGVAQPHGGFWFPNSGWLNPPAVCKALIGAHNITLHQHCGEISLHNLHASDGRSLGGIPRWQARSADRVLTEAACVIIAAGVQSSALAQLGWLPLRSIRGQTTDLPTTPESRELKAVFCHRGYLPPARGTSHCMGASFDPEDGSKGPTVADHADNLEQLATAVPAWRTWLRDVSPGSLSGRVGFRAASPDYLPMVGPVPNMADFERDYGALRYDARQLITQPGQYRSGLYLNTGHGSRGLTSTPLAGELLASEICGESPPLQRDLRRALAPARFLIRQLIRGQRGA
ncbi:MAG: bifunctional tRNA (5-methylaminomethyl-2-thiouridine)(34)-methyltransferase MnmD/FAD-dependent 5-carboxymethylaminomethyl-2-thiouridine(34) oxidoreductase MnmC [Pseudomonadota bacterium]